MRDWVEAHNRRERARVERQMTVAWGVVDAFLLGLLAAAVYMNLATLR